jgi:endonuclease-3 related protein
MLKLLDVYNKLRAYHGSQGWWPAETAFEVLVGAVLTQRTTWRNAAKGIENLRRKGLLEPTNLALTEEDEITECIRCTGFYRQKAERLLGIARIITWRYRGSLESMFEGATTEELRELLISWKGIGTETADSILLYAANRHIFPIDQYTIRLMKRLGVGSDDRQELRALFMSQLPDDLCVYKEFHALIDEHAKTFCRKEPRCASCPLREDCIYPA